MRLLRLPVPVLGALLLAALSSLPEQYRVGQASFGALLTALVATSALVVLPSLLAHPVKGLAPWVLFVGWALFVGLARGFTFDGIQNLTVYVGFGLIAWVTAVHGTRHRDLIYQAMLQTGWLIAGLYAASIAMSGVGASTVFAARAFGIQALAFMALTVPVPKDTRWHRLLPVVLFLLVAVSLSRTSTAVAGLLLIVGAAHGRTRRPRRAVFAAVVLALGVSFAIVSVPTLNQRVFGGDASLAVGGVHFNGEGRAQIWHQLTSEIHGYPLIGHGPGASSTYLLHQHPVLADEPHNDYLRVLFDYGWIGEALLVWGFVRPLRTSIRRARQTSDMQQAAPHTIAALALASIALVMITDNVLIYSWAMAPAAVLVGLSLGSTPARSPATPPRRQPAPAT